MPSPVGAPGLYHPRAYDLGEPVPTYWRDTAGPAAEFAPLHTTIGADVAVIGGGITGLSTALHLARDSGVNVAVLEAGEIGWGASGRNGGFCVPGGAKRSRAALARGFGAEDAARFDRLSHAAVDRVAGLLASENIAAEPQHGGEMLFAHSARALDGFRRHGGGIVLGPGALRERGMYAAGFHGALWEPVGFGLHPLSYVRGLAMAAHRHGVRIFERSPVVDWRRDRGGHIVTTPSGAVCAAKLVVAAGAYQPETLSPLLAGRVLPVQSNILVTRPLTEAERQAQGWTSTAVASDSLRLLHYFRLLPDGRFLFGGRGGLSASPAGAARFRARLTRDFHRLFPAWRDVDITHFWSGLVDLAADLVPHCAALDDSTLQACAYHGSGVALGTEMGAQLALLATDGTAPSLPAFVQRPAPRFVLPVLRKAYLAGALSLYALCDALP